MSLETLNAYSNEPLTTSPEIHQRPTTARGRQRSVGGLDHESRGHLSKRGGFVRKFREKQNHA